MVSQISEPSTVCEPERNKSVDLCNVGGLHYRFFLGIIIAFIGIPTVDGRNPATAVILKTYETWDILHINWLAGFLPSTVLGGFLNHEQY